jgi:purine-binding chemotaxis protein CheW
MRLGVDASQVQEIVRRTETTRVPDAPSVVRGVTHLRGEVVAVLDLRVVLGLPSAEADAEARTIVLDVDGERIGLLVDSVADVREVGVDDLVPAPPNFDAACRTCCPRVIVDDDQELSAVLDAGALLSLSEGG